MRVLFAGTSGIGRPALRFLLRKHDLVGVLTQPDRPAGRRRELKAPEIKEEIQRLAPCLPLLQPESLRLLEAMEWARDLAPEVIVTMAYGKILPKAFLEIPSVACLNIHASLLPKHRGASPIQAAIACGDRVSGVTIMYMGEGLDTGDVLLERSLPLRRRETFGSLAGRLAESAPEALSEALELLAAGKAPRFPQDHGQATLTAKITRSETFLDWDWEALRLERKIRSLQPVPGAICSLPLASGGGILLKVHSAIVVRGAEGRPGCILRSDARGLLVACREGGLLLGTVQPEGKGRMRSSDFARGHALATEELI